MRCKSNKLSRIFYVILVVLLFISAQAMAESKQLDFDTVKILAEQGDAEAQFNMAMMYGNGKGVPKDLKEAVHWLKKAAERGHIKAQSCLGGLYVDGDEGLPQDYEKGVYWYTKAAEAGETEVQWNLGAMYDLGAGIPQDSKKAMYWYNKAAKEEGEDSIFCTIGSLFYWGDGVPKNMKKAAYWFNKAIEHGCSSNSIYFELAVMYFDGDGVPQDYNKSLSLFNKSSSLTKKQYNCDSYSSYFYYGEFFYHGYGGVPKDSEKGLYWYLKAASFGDNLAQNKLIEIYGDEIDTSQVKNTKYWLTKGAELGYTDFQSDLGWKNYISEDYKNAFHWYSKVAELGEARAQYMIGELYDTGKGVPQDYKKAVHWYTKAAKQGYASAQHNLGYMYRNGEGVPQDYKKAVHWYTKAAEQGYVLAQVLLGIMYDTGKGVPQDYKKAVYWYTKAAEQGDADAQYYLGIMYDTGKGVPQDYKKAVYWYTKAAEQGDADAQYYLGNMYRNGEGVPQDYKKAVHWYTKAAEQGYASAQHNLGFVYGNGIGVPQNYIRAYAWFNLAAAQGEKNAINNREIVSSKMTPQQIAQAQEFSVQLQYRIEQPDESSVKEETLPDASDSQNPNAYSSGTGFLISKDGYLLTCHHVVDNARSIKVIVGDNSYPAKLVRDDKYNDLALLKISGRFSALSFSPNRSAAMGQDIFTIGYPNPLLQGTSAKLTKGTINSLTGFMDDLRLYQVSVPVQPGNSGGPLLDMNGNVAGVIVAVLDAKIAFNVTGSLPQNVNYAVKKTYAQALLDTLPEVSAKLLPPSTKKRGFETVAAQVKKSIVMVVTAE
ncbi:MAG: trypsin-like peptidase domain-containing protein [Desulfobacterales bacterium]|nr:trypsin-like peptidase domain-containing protein [Desulfobacterales bacterium]